MFCLSRPYQFKFCKGYLPQILLGPFLNTLSHLRPCQTYTELLAKIIKWILAVWLFRLMCQFLHIFANLALFHVKLPVVYHFSAKNTIFEKWLTSSVKDFLVVFPVLAT